VICLGGCSGSYTNGPIPNTAFAGASVFGFWDDLFLNAGTSQSIYYASTGTAPNRELVFEYLTARCCYYTLTQTYHFQIVFFENAPGVVAIRYYQVWDGGNSATIGVQGESLCE
jgi:hypothetical protein